jgi:hypothetical protein
LLLESREGAPPHQPGTARRALALACGVVAALAAMTASPPVGLLLCSLAALTSPVAVRLVWRRTTAAADGPTTSPAEHPAHQSGALDRPVTTVAALTDAELCRLWRGTFWELQARRAPDQVLRMVALRQSCLDELERRHPSALHAWLVSGARASGGPEKFLTDGERPGSADAA